MTDNYPEAEKRHVRESGREHCVHVSHIDMHVQGIIHGKQIELTHETGAPDGTMLWLEIHLSSLPLQEKRQLVDELCGSWANDPSLSQIFAEIDTQRHRSTPREITFDTAP